MQGPFGFVFHQVAIYTHNVEASVRGYKSLGFRGWTYDECLLKGMRIINNEWQEVSTHGVMAFNYDIMPMELEFLHYEGGEHRHREREQLSRVPFISHMSVHVKSVTETMDWMRSVYSMVPYHVFVTNDHTNQMVAGIKRFIECIYDTRSMFGYDIKCIERIPHDSTVEVEDILMGLPRP